MKKLIDYGVIKSQESEIEKIIEIAGNFADEYDNDQQDKIKIDMDEITKKALQILVDKLSAEEEPEDIQNTIYQIAKANQIQPKEFFRILYQIILGTSRGPKIGPFISDIGRKQVSKTFQSIYNNGSH